MSDCDSIYPMLIIDMASRRPWLGFKREASMLEWIATDSEPSKMLFESLKELKEKQKFDFNEIASISYNEGPGSMLGIRTAIMAIRTWQSTKIVGNIKLFAYNTLIVGFKSISPTSNDKTQIVVTDARRQSWNSLSSNFDEPKSSHPTLVEDEVLESLDAECYLLKDFPQWTKSAINFTKIDYKPETFFERADFLDFLKKTEVAKPFVLREAEYQKWVPRFKSQETKG